VGIKRLERSTRKYYAKIVFKCCLSNKEEGTQNDILWDDNEESGKDLSSSEMQLKDHWMNSVI
jgi:hypothetical protein